MTDVIDPVIVSVVNAAAEILTSTQTVRKTKPGGPPRDTGPFDADRFARSIRNYAKQAAETSLDDPRLFDIYTGMASYDIPYEHPLHNYELRRRYIKERSFAIATPDAIDKIAEHGPIVEIGAGNGWWAHLIAKKTRIIAFDTFTSHGTSARYFNVHMRGSKVLKAFPKHTLFLCWPPYDDEMAARTLDRYLGDTLIYVGEGDGGCTGGQRFHDMLAAQWEEVDFLAIPQWWGIRDYLWVYKR